MGLQSSPRDPAAIAAREAACAFYQRMESALGSQDFLAGSYSFADIAFYMAQIFGARMGAPIGPETPMLLRWRERITSRPAVRQVVGPMVAYLLAQNRPIPDFLDGVPTAAR